MQCMCVHVGSPPAPRLINAMPARTDRGLVSGSRQEAGIGAFAFSR